MPDQYSSDPINTTYQENLFHLKKEIDLQISSLKQTSCIERVYNIDHTLWSDDDTEISNRLGWLDIAERITESVFDINNFVQQIVDEGFKHILLLGMGGSSLSSEVFKSVFDKKENYPELIIVDSTDPDFILDIKNKIDLQKTLLIVSTKSGSTVETLSLLKYFYNEIKTSNISDNPGEYFVAITDPSSKLSDIANDCGFRKVFINDPNIGGRFSVLSFFGLVPAALIGVDIEKLLVSATALSVSLRKTELSNYLTDPTIRLGATIGYLAKKEIDKLTFFFSNKFYSFGYWAEQLIAESTGKKGMGVLPVLDQKGFDNNHLKDDRVFIFFINESDSSFEDKIQWLDENNKPYIVITIQDIYDIGAEFFRFEFVTALTGIVLGINPFDQPDVESAKNYTRQFLDSYKTSKKLELPKEDFLLNETIKIISNKKLNNTENFLSLFTDSDFGYISIQAYVNPNKRSNDLLSGLRDKIEEISKLPVTLDFGPRFLHSTGQLHKGDSGKGLFLQIVSDNKNDLLIPNELDSDESDLSFGILKKAQAIGDFSALSSKNRAVVSCLIPSDEFGSISDIFD